MSAGTPERLGDQLGGVSVPPAQLGMLPSERGRKRELLAHFRRDRLAMAGAIILVAIVLVTIFAQLIAPYASNAAFNVGAYAPPSGAHLLGTDGQARDVLSRLIWGGRVSLPSAVLPAVIAMPLGLLIGTFAAQARGIAEDVLMRIVDIGLSFPIVLLAVAIAGVAGGGFWTVVIAIGCALTPYTARVAYNVTQTLRSSDFVVAARATGEGRWQLLRWELLPNVLPPVIVYITSLLGTTMVVASGLSFFGLGAAPPTADWGQMINDGRVALSTAPLVSLAPGALIVISALCFTFIGDGVRNVLDPSA